MIQSFKRSFVAVLAAVLATPVFAENFTEQLPDLPEEHFPALKSLLGASANRKLSRELREAEARARIEQRRGVAT